MADLNTPLWQMTAGELVDLVIKTIKQEDQQSNPGELKQGDINGFVYGITGIAEIFNCSKSTAQKIKNSGVINKAISQNDRKMTINVEMALKLTQIKR